MLLWSGYGWLCYNSHRMKRLAFSILGVVAVLVLATNACATGVETPAGRCLAELRAAGASPDFYWALTYSWFDHNAKDGDRRNAILSDDGNWCPRPLADTVLETPAWRAEAKVEQTFGVLPKYYYLDFFYTTGTVRPSAYYAANRASMTAIVRKAWAVHRAVPVFSWHMEHYCVTNGFKAESYRFKCSKHKNLVRAIVQGEKDGAFAPRDWFKSRLVEIAGFLNGLTDETGKKIPVIIRYAHEMDGSWFWWGKDDCSKADFIALARMEADFLRARCGGQILFAYTPDRWWSGIGEEGRDGYLAWYPGDAYVDVIGYDDYAIGGGKTPEDRRKNFGSALEKMRTLSDYATAHGKVVCLSESGNPSSGFFYEDIHRLMTSDGVHAAFFNSWIGPWTWPNTEEGKADMARFVGHPQVKFISNGKGNKRE